MAGPDAKTSEDILTASLAERPVAPVRVNLFAARTWFSVTLATILMLHGGILAWMLWRDAEHPPQVALQKETPVEVVVEPPKPEAKAPEAKPPQPEPKQAVEKPASSAPRAPNEEKTETAQNDAETHAPKAPEPPTEGAPSKAEASAEPDSQKAKPDETQEEAAKPPDVLEKDAEALDRLPPEPPKKPAQFAKAKPVAKQRLAKTALQQLAGNSDLPDFKFAKPMKKKAKVFGGTEDDRYLAVVYGMIMQNKMPIEVPEGEWSVAVAFQVDGEGNLDGIGIQQSSGYDIVDEQAIAAVRRAAPFPAPPQGAPHGLVARLRSSNTPVSTMRMGER